MKLLAIIAITTLTLFAAPHQAPSTSAEQEVRALIADIDTAMKSRDRARIDHLMAADFVMLHSTGNLEARQSFLDRAGAGTLLSQRVPAETLEDTLRLYDGHTALRTTRIKATLHSPNRPAEEASIRSIDVYVKISGQWLWVSEQSTPIPAPNQR